MRFWLSIAVTVANAPQRTPLIGRDCSPPPTPPPCGTNSFQQPLYLISHRGSTYDLTGRRQRFRCNGSRLLRSHFEHEWASLPSPPRLQASSRRAETAGSSQTTVLFWTDSELTLTCGGVKQHVNVSRLLAFGRNPRARGERWRERTCRRLLQWSW